MSLGPKKNALVLQGGGCTAVMNRSLAGLVQEALQSQAFGQVLGALHGLEGLLNGSIIDLERPSKRTWQRVAASPGAALGSGRRKLRDQDMPAVAEVLERHRVGYFFVIGGNDSAETALGIYQGAQGSGGSPAVLHVPKTIDNDLPLTDHTPGYGSAARFVALATMGAAMDAQAMGSASPVTVLEVMGRDAGWLAASSALGKTGEDDAPHFIGLPEVPVDEDLYLKHMEEAYRRRGFAVAVAAENSSGAGGVLGGQREPFYVDDFGHQYYEGAGRYLAQLVGRHLKVRARYEKPGTIQRSLSTCVSRADAREAAMVGRMAVVRALEGCSGSMITLERAPGDRYECVTGLAPLDGVAGKVRPMPEEYLDPQKGTVTGEFLEYARPLLGGPLPRYATLL